MLDQRPRLQSTGRCALSTRGSTSTVREYSSLISQSLIYCHIATSIVIFMNSWSLHINMHGTHTAHITPRNEYIRFCVRSSAECFCSSETCDEALSKHAYTDEFTGAVVARIETGGDAFVSTNNYGVARPVSYAHLTTTASVQKTYSNARWLLSSVHCVTATSEKNIEGCNAFLSIKRIEMMMMYDGDLWAEVRHSQGVHIADRRRSRQTLLLSRVVFYELYTHIIPPTAAVYD